MDYEIKTNRTLIQHTKRITLIDAPLIDRNTWGSAYKIRPTLVTFTYYGKTRNDRFEADMKGLRLRKDGTFGDVLTSVYAWGHNAEFAQTIRDIAHAEDPREPEPNFVGGLPEDLVNRLRAENKELTSRLDDILTKITSLAPECWDDDVAADAIVINYVKSLAEGTTTIPGHADGCSCFE